MQIGFGWFFVGFIQIYQKWISPLKRQTCRYYPTCSLYSLILFKKAPLFYAIFFSIIRIFRCNPWAKGGYDYPLMRVELRNIEHRPIDFVYWIIPSKTFDLKLLRSNQSIKIWAYILLKD